jgi:hypothetical protein
MGIEAISRHSIRRANFKALFRKRSEVFRTVFKREPISRHSVMGGGALVATGDLLYKGRLKARYTAIYR